MELAREIAASPHAIRGIKRLANAAHDADPARCFKWKPTSKSR